MLVRLTPAKGRNLTTPQTARARLSIPDTVSDDTVAAWIEAASDDIAGYCERTFGREILQETATGYGIAEWALRLSRGPATVRRVVVDGVQLEAGDYLFDEDSRELWAQRGGILGGWWSNRVIVEYAAGWSLPGEPDRDLPRAVEEACLALVATSYFGEGRDPRLRSDSVEGVGSSSWIDYRPGSGGMPQQVAERLAPYVRHSVG